MFMTATHSFALITNILLESKLEFKLTGEGNAVGSSN